MQITRSDTVLHVKWVVSLVTGDGPLSLSWVCEGEHALSPSKVVCSNRIQINLNTT